MLLTGEKPGQTVGHHACKANPPPSFYRRLPGMTQRTTRRHPLGYACQRRYARGDGTHLLPTLDASFGRQASLQPARTIDSKLPEVGTAAATAGNTARRIGHTGRRGPLTNIEPVSQRVPTNSSPLTGRGSGRRQGAPCGSQWPGYSAMSSTSRSNVVCDLEAFTPHIRTSPRPPDHALVGKSATAAVSPRKHSGDFGTLRRIRCR